MKIIHIIFATCTALLSSACVTVYVSPQENPETLAVLRVKSDSLRIEPYGRAVVWGSRANMDISLIRYEDAGSCEFQGGPMNAGYLGTIQLSKDNHSSKQKIRSGTPLILHSHIYRFIIGLRSEHCTHYTAFTPMSGKTYELQFEYNDTRCLSIVREVHQDGSYQQLSDLLQDPKRAPICDNLAGSKLSKH